jgi:hypothetical protein
MPPYSMGLNGRLRCYQAASYNNSAGAKSTNMKFGGSTIMGSAPTTTLSLAQSHEIMNRGVYASQVTGAAGNTSFLASATAPSVLSIDTTASVDITSTLQLATATDFIQYDLVYVEAFPA